MKKKIDILFLIAILNLVGIFLMYVNSFITKNNHHSLSIDTIFITTSLIILLISIFSLKPRVIMISILALILSIAMNIFNIKIGYETWIKRDQPAIFTR